VRIPDLVIAPARGLVASKLLTASDVLLAVEIISRARHCGRRAVPLRVDLDALLPVKFR